jgi:Tol biopolymer transport system component
VKAQTDPSFYGFPDNHLPWFSIHTEHFTIHYQEGNQRSARVIAGIAEDIFEPITSLYQHKPDSKTAIVLKDREDYSNGAAYFFDNKIDIWVPALDTPLRGSHHWLRNVIAHEFTHIVQIQAAMKRKRTVPAVYLQWLSYENVRRPDVLYGFPNGIATYPFASVNVPAWLAEGTAQYQREGLHYDSWDAHRDMILRSRVLSNTVMSLDEMGTFAGKNSLERETVYNHGYAFSIWLANTYGEGVLNDISRALAQPGLFDVRKALQVATGVPGDSLHAAWVRDLKKTYSNWNDAALTRTEKLEQEGFFNFQPRVSPDGRFLAYMSNRGRDYGRVSLWVRNLQTGALVKAAELQTETTTGGASYRLSCGLTIDPVINLTSGSFDFSPDGTHIVYTKIVQNRFGERYNDLFLYNVKTKKHKRLTTSKRLSEPAWHPDGNHIAALQSQDGTLNLVLVDRNTKNIKTITRFKDGEQLFQPVWTKDGQRIYASYAFKKHRRVAVIDVKTGDLTLWAASDSVDYRDPMPTSDGTRVLFSASNGGVFNIWSAKPDGSDAFAITAVSGGAFQPVAGTDGTIYFSEFTETGYKISKLEPEGSGRPRKPVSSSAIVKKSNLSFARLHAYTDTIQTLIEEPRPVLGDTLETSFTLFGAAENYDAKLSRYRGDYTSLSLFPIVRFDNYSRLNGGNGALLRARNFGGLRENLVRDTKGGLYFASRDVRDRFTLFGGAMVGPGSYPVADGWASSVSPNRIASLDRDLFLIFEHQGLPFLRGFWNPTISIEMYNLRRNVANGLQIEDFGCSACLPDTIGVDISYDIWQADIYLRSKLNLFSMLELGISHSPFTVTTEPFFSKEYRQMVPKGSQRYFIGTTISAAYVYRVNVPSAVSDVVPAGMRGMVRVALQPARLLNRYEIRDGALFPVYASTNNVSLEAQYRIGVVAPNGGFSFRGRVFHYLTSNNEYFYLDYIGGFTGMRSYPFFALGGNTTAFGEISGYLPVWKRINRQFGRFTVNSIWIRGFLETGNGWGGPLGISSSPKTGAGAELRVSTNSYYLFPSKFFVSTAYGFNRFSLQLPSGFVGTDGGHVQYGRSALVYFGLLFDFEL